MSDFVNTMDLLGDDVAARMIVDRTIEEYKDDVISKIGQSAFHGCSKLASVDMPNVTSVGNYAFYECSALTSVDFPLVTTLADSMFYRCQALTSVNLPLVADVVYASAGKFFDYCYNLKSVNLSSLTRIDGFKDCRSLESLDLPNASVVKGACFSGCKSLKFIILRSSTLCTLSGTSAFSGTPFASGGTGGTLIVPSSLVESYKTATNWSVIWGYGHNRFLALEDYTVDGTITGEIDWDKLGGTT